MNQNNKLILIIALVNHIPLSVRASNYLLLLLHSLNSKIFIRLYFHFYSFFYRFYLCSLFRPYKMKCLCSDCRSLCMCVCIAQLCSCCCQFHSFSHFHSHILCAHWMNVSRTFALDFPTKWQINMYEFEKRPRFIA